MALKQAIKTLVLPNGIVPASGGTAAGDLALSIVLVPELSGGAGPGGTGTLNDFPDLLNWPATLTAAGTDFGFVVTLAPPAPPKGTAPPVITIRLPITAASTEYPLNSSLWTTLFNASTPYTPRTPPSSEPLAIESGAVPLSAAVVSYPTTPIADFVTGQFNTLPLDRKPTYSDVAPVYGPVADGLVGAAGTAAIARQMAQRRANGVADFSGASVAEALAAQRYFHTPATQPQTPSSTSLNSNEFHAALTMITHHRALQRALGLVFDFEIRPNSSDQLSAGLSKYGGDGWMLTAEFVSSLSSTPPTPYAPGGAAQPGPVTMVTAATVSTTALYLDDIPGSGYGTIHEGGSVPVGGGSYGTHTHNIEMAGLNAANFAEKVASYTTPPTSGGTSPPTVIVVPNTLMIPPTLDSAGITLTQLESELAWTTMLQRQALLYELYDPTADDKNNTETSPLYASDLVAGLTLDVLDSSDPTAGYLSLNTRNVTYSPGPNKPGAFTPFNVFDEAALQSLPTLGIGPLTGPLPVWYVSDSLMRFTGWSNAVPRPGVAAPGPDNAGLTSTGGPFAGVLDIQVTAAPPEDFSGPSILVPRLRFGRTYTLAVRAIDVANNVVPAGSTADENGYNTGAVPYGRQDVIPSPDVFAQNGTPRSYPNYGESLRTLVIRDLDVPSGTGSRRIFAPSSVDPEFAIQHGMLDIKNGNLDASPSGAAAARNWLAAHTDPAKSTYLAPIATAATAPKPAIPSIDVTQPVPYIADPLARGGSLQVSDAATVTGDAVANGLADRGGFVLPASGFSFQVNGTYNLNVQSDGTLMADPVQPVAFRLIPGAAGAARSATWDSSNRLITVSLQPADVAVIDLSCTFNGNDLEAAPTGFLFGSIVQTSPNWDGNVAASGGNWALTPATELKLVYATQRPLIPPTFTTITAAPRNLGDTFVLLEGSMQWSPNSTSHIDVFAQWADAIDRGPGSGPPNPTVSNNGVGGGQPVAGVPVFTAPPDYVPVAAGANPPVSGFASAGRETAQVTDAFSAGRHEFHDTKNRSVYYTAIGTTRFEEYFPDVTAAGARQNPDPDTSTIFGESVNVKSSSRPAAPLIDSVVPTYGWTGPTLVNSAEIQSTRSPSALRVWLDRPWFSSGIGELLGVVTWPQAEGGLSGNAVKRRPDRAAAATEAKHRETKSHHHETKSEHHASADVDATRRHVTEIHHGRTASEHAAKLRAHLSGLPPAPIPDPISHYVSDWGLDPVFGSAQNLPSAHLNLESFTAASVLGNTIPLEELPNTMVNVAGHPVTYDPVSDRWYAEIVIDFGGAYSPMVRLALVRYQPNSILSAEISRVAVIDVHALEQGRTVTLYRQERGGVAITLTGISYNEIAGGTQLYTSNEGAIIDGVPGIAIAQLQQKTGPDPDLGWKPVGEQVTLNGSIASDGTATWRGELPTVASGGRPQRVHIVQYELLPKLPDATGSVLGERIMFQDLIPMKF